MKRTTGIPRLLKPCPFCGSKATGLHLGRASVWCSWCGAIGPAPQEGIGAISGWNQRQVREVNRHRRALGATRKP